MITNSTVSALTTDGFFAAPEAEASVYPHASDEAKSAISVATEAYVAQMPHNRDQPSQHGFTGALNPPRAHTLP